LQYGVLPFLSLEYILGNLSTRLCKSDTLIQLNWECSYESNWSSLSWRPDQYDVDPKECARMNLINSREKGLYIKPTDDEKWIRGRWEQWGLTIKRYITIENLSEVNKHMIECLYDLATMKTMVLLDEIEFDFMIDAYQWIHMYGLPNGDDRRNDYHIDYEKYEFLQEEA